MNVGCSWMFFRRQGVRCVYGVRLVREIVFAGTEGHSNEVRKHRKTGSQRRSGSLSTQKSRQGVAGAARRASGHQIGVGMMQFVGSALQRGKVIAQST